MKYLTALIAGLLISVHLAGQNYAGHMYDNETSQAVGYVSIGIVGKAVGTVSDGNGAYNLVLESQYDADTLKFTCIGYQSVSMKVGDYKNRSDQNIYFQPAPKPIEEVVILGKQFIQRTLGITSTTKNCYGGFKDCGLGYELGLQMNVRKPAVIERLHLNIVVCTYDSIF